MTIRRKDKNYFMRVKYSEKEKFIPIGFISSIHKAKKIVGRDDVELSFTPITTITIVGKTKIYKSKKKEKNGKDWSKLGG